jgi:hypothetical protein
LFTLPEACLYGDLVNHLESLAGLRIGEEVSITISIQKHTIKTHKRIMKYPTKTNTTNHQHTTMKYQFSLKLQVAEELDPDLETSLTLHLKKSSEFLSMAGISQKDLSYTNLFQDVRRTFDYIHGEGALKSKVCEETE